MGGFFRIQSKIALSLSLYWLGLKKSVLRDELPFPSFYSLLLFRSEKDVVPDSVRGAMAIYINSQDCIPRMSLASIAKLLAVARAIDDLPLTGMQQMRVSNN